MRPARERSALTAQLPHFGQDIGALITSVHAEADAPGLRVHSQWCG
jgi:hypothetical protein